MTANRVAAELRTFLLNKIVDDWSTITPEARPETIWVGEHEPTDNPDSPLISPLVAAWLFDGREFHEKPSSSMAAFLNLSAGFLNTTGSFEIGIAGFAPIIDTEEVALYWQFGGLHGMGYLCSSSRGCNSCDEAWRS